ncbi:hypothetical protein PT974_02936 [Cladobotryum mycophilum]|uniref:Nudix hydrolase domain-containing protein n=1 Tax=Cladobotryum mycophilum TaxID=491253 RepID=A0ABR0SZH4_9HYPO
MSSNEQLNSTTAPAHTNGIDFLSLGSNTNNNIQVWPFDSSQSLSSLTAPLPAFLSSYPHITNFMTATLIFQSPPPPPHPLTAPSPPAAPPSEPKVLLLRRAPTDSYPLSWELPGGSVDPTDPSILSAAARELWEETSLQADHFSACLGMLPGDIIAPEPEVVDWGVLPEKDDAKEEETAQGIKIITFGETGQVWGKITLLADVRDTRDVNIRPDEHMEWAWVSEREVLTGWLGGEKGEEKEKRVLGLVSASVRSQILEAFRLKREEKKN